ncbi:MAG: MCE family protein [Simkaniaceae bacterium]|nr:MCE family protein [Simkaniaceae bacterium]
MGDYVKNILIGLFVVVACSLIVGIVLFLEPTVGDGKQTLVMRFSSINGLSLGTRVMFAGKPVGEVVSIEQIPHAREQPTDQSGQIYFYQLILHVDSSVQAYNTDEFTIQTSGLLGEKSIAIIPRTPPKGVTPTRVTAATPIYAESIDPIENVFNELSSVADKMEEALEKVIAWIDQNGAELGSAIRSFDDAMSEGATLLERVNQLKIVDDVKVAVKNIAETMEEVNAGVQELQHKQFFANLGTTMDSAKNTMNHIDTITSNVAEGKGTIGKLFSNDETYLQVTSVLSKVNTLMNDVNHYGLFYNLNKEWQRSRLKEANFVNALRTPGQFKAYFEKEVDGINTSMSRLSMLITKAEQNPNREEILQSKSFRNDFAELMRLTQEISDNLKLYNEQLLQASGE